MNGFGPRFRLKTSEDFSYLKEGSDSLRSKYIKIYFKKTRKDGDQTRIGLAVSKKLGNAGKRNRVKRLLREQFRLSDFKNLGHDILFVVSPHLYKNNEDGKLAEEQLLESSSYIWSKFLSRVNVAQ